MVAAGATVHVYDQGTENEIGETIFQQDSDHASSALTYTNPLTADSEGHIEFYLAAAARVTLAVSKTGYTSETRVVDVAFPYAAATEGYQTIKDSGSSETQRTVLDFQDGFVVTDDGSETEVDLDYGAASDIADVALADAAGTSAKVARADHVHGGFGFARKTGATARNTTTTLADDPHLTFAIGASEVWLFEAVLFVTSTSTTPDIKLDVTFPTSAAFRYGGTGPGSAVTAVAGVANFDECSLTSHDLTYGTINGDVIVILKGICINSTNAGNITVRWAQGTSDAADVTVQARSFIHGRRVS